MLKYCYICKEKKTLDCFYSDKNRYDGLNKRCKPCDIIHRNKYKFHSRPRPGDTEAMKRYAKRYAKTPEGKKAINEASQRSRAKYPEKWNARARLRYAVKKGEITKPQYCERLGSTCSDFTKIQAHHYAGYDGDNWKNVSWLCSRHHADEHLSIRRMGLSITSL